MNYDSGSLSNKLLGGVIYTSVGKISTQAVQFFLSIIIARYVTPAEYGVLGIVLVFVNLSQVLIDSGFGRAIIYKNNLDENDLQTVFTFNTIVSLALYAIVFIASGWIGAFFNMYELECYLRVAAAVLILNAFIIVPDSILHVKLDFKSIALTNLISNILSGVIGVLCACCGFGIWSLIVQLLLKSLLQSICQFIFCRWIPRFHFYSSSFISMFKYSVYLVTSSCITKGTEESVSFFIGKFFTPYSLGVYSRAKQFASLPGNIISSILTSMVFPVLSSLKYDVVRLNAAYKNFIRVQSLFTTPLYFFLAMVSKPLVLILLTEKWIDIVIIIRIFCIGSVLNTMAVISEQVLLSKGLSHIALRQQIIKMIVKFFSIIGAMYWGLTVLVIVEALVCILSYFITNYFVKNYVEYRVCSQLMDFSKPVIASTIAVFLGYWGMSMCNGSIVEIVLGLSVSLCVYVFLISIFCKELVNELLRIIRIKVYGK